MDTNENRKDKVMKLKCVEVYEGLYHQEPFDVAKSMVWLSIREFIWHIIRSRMVLLSYSL